MIKTPIVSKAVKITKEEPVTEVKRVPYRITDNEQGDMFEEFSCSSDFEKIDTANVGQGLFGANTRTTGFNLNVAEKTTKQ